MNNFYGVAYAILADGMCTMVGYLMQPRFDLVNIAMVYLLAVVIIALYFSRPAAVFSSLISVATFDFIFVPPQGHFTVDDIQYVFTFSIMLVVALVISRLTRDLRHQAITQSQLTVHVETERIRSALLASISHDLRTPLAVIAGASSALANGGERVPVADRLALAKSIEEQANELSARLNKILQMTKLETGTIELTTDWVAIGEIIGAALSKLENQLSKYHVVVDVPLNLPLIKVDAALIEQVLLNLLENAARHTPEHTLVRACVRQLEDSLEISVEDDGPGIAASDIDKLFGKFQRIAGQSRSGGVGLGLAICRAIVSLHQGQTWVERLPTGGTSFRFTLPLPKLQPQHFYAEAK
jgi:two-component system sensor histidine kinase KdpD